eukprot:3895309-Alexandrium_andersonii.AAC.1
MPSTKARRCRRSWGAPATFLLSSQKLCSPRPGGVGCGERGDARSTVLTSSTTQRYDGGGSPTPAGAAGVGHGQPLGPPGETDGRHPGDGAPPVEPPMPMVVD